MLNPESPRHQRQWLILPGSLLLVALIAWFDYVTRWEWSCFIFYAVPIFLVTWYMGERPGFLIAVLCTLAWYVALGDHSPYQTHAGVALAVASRGFYFVVLIVATTAVKRRQAMDRECIARLERTQALELDVLWAREREQQRIGSDLHDSLGSHLAAITYAATFLMNDLSERKQPEAELARQLRDMVDDAVAAVRDMSHDIYPAEIDASGLALALRDLATATTQSTGISVAFYESGDKKVETADVVMHFYRIAQEAINNAAKHGHARKITIVLNKQLDILRMIIADDGKGMAMPHNGTRGLGLRTMRYRARALGGDLSIDSSPSEGTVVSCEVPLHSPVTSMTAT